ncbi:MULTISPECIES: DegT/DnrJ/EryC1/StrS family aminotransferase [Streptomyces]|uniref:DegT/DnrJ/EryC1/StrS family aminotransferase n=1 Tax=Streptomyces caniscabiei TaxID=2746961 RepID=A0ABU4N0H1_9ACTN|nr:MULTISPECIES: DegT/DnrJ/EryC1/StrS family aminotransferase [Streptomyces]MBE4741306.1 DegT/DnrJ/EryC1/StrS family aminotransferase [Streptomyces caniscabiei]MBE4760957.1 DegT/DnrJ/EryC1/StrS family aminotransferase [Streptomyces caniscabiei]MBE4774886.1 DegT/DnrJ/EryC1/StrS family aminotransferase [Streptomyces caniscabiei]MBE4789644.1 DegT/DnrJ/EryC1/StrS family aminotransferase [Streptomyces caniscabiei]MBE4798827.1 DegT/DnrJ/EryC1/StrS family aminotransferase [Streptomyces caniscabiei]
MTQNLALLGGTPVIKSPLEERWPAFHESDVEAAAELVRRGEISYNGREGTVRDLEEHFRDYVGTRYALAVNSGTSALHSAFFAIGLHSGDEVLAPTYTFHATVMPVFACNAVPVLVDAEADTGNIDPTLLEAHITARTKAIVATHLNGYPVDMATILAVARKHGLWVIEDCSQAHGAECDGRRVGGLGDVAAFSMQSRKQVTAGAGGILTTNDDRVHERAVLFGHSLNRSVEAVVSDEYRRFASTGLGLNLRMHPVAAVLADRSLARLDDLLKVREANCAHLDAMLSRIDGVHPPVRRPHMTRVAHYSHQPLYRQEELGDLSIGTFVRALAAEGVPVSRPKSPPLHQEPAFQDPEWKLDTYHPGPANSYRRYRDRQLPNSETYVATALRLPVFSRDMRAELDAVGEAFEKVTQQAGVLRDLERAGRVPAPTP